MQSTPYSKSELLQHRAQQQATHEGQPEYFEEHQKAEGGKEHRLVVTALRHCFADEAKDGEHDDYVHRILAPTGPEGAIQEDGYSQDD